MLRQESSHQCLHQGFIQSLRIHKHLASVASVTSSQLSLSTTETQLRCTRSRPSLPVKVSNATNRNGGFRSSTTIGTPGGITRLSSHLATRDNEKDRWAVMGSTLRDKETRAQGIRRYRTTDTHGSSVPRGMWHHTGVSVAMPLGVEEVL